MAEAEEFVGEVEDLLGAPPEEGVEGVKMIERWGNGCT